jgi:glycosyltransferase involved in cell wall biosynthesis
MTLSSTAIAVVRALRTDFELVHFTHEAPGIFAPLTGARGVPSVVSVCGLDWKRSKWNGLAQRAIRQAERIGVMRADAIIALSRGIQRYLTESYLRDVAYVPNGIIVKPAPAWSGRLERFGLRPHGYVAFVARLVPEKGCHLLIDAWTAVESDKVLAVAGAGRAGDRYVDSLRSRAPEGRVVFTGHLAGQDLDEFFCYASLFVLPSFVEGQSVALLEALGWKRACLVSDIEENVSVLDGNGFTFRSGSIPSLREALARLFDQPQLLRTMEDRVGKARHQYPSWEEVATLHEEIYARAIAHHREGASKSRLAA